jgi:histidyl-tRNA synthetase
MAKDPKSTRPRAETPKGFRDYFGAEVTDRAAMLGKIAKVYHRYGFDALESAAVETVEALGKFLPDVDRPNAGVFAWQEMGEDTKPGDWLALRYDLTAPLARVYAQHRNDLPTPYRRYAMGPVWRNEKPGPGRFRQFYQCDADTVGAASVAADAEICAMLADALEEVGIPRGDYIVRVNNRKVLNGVLEVMGLPEGEAREAVLRTIDKFDKVGAEGVRALLGKGRLDASGAYIDGVGLSEAQIAPVMSFINYFDVVQNSLSLEATRAIEEGNEARGRQLDRSRYSVLYQFKNDPLASDLDALQIWNTRVLDHLRSIIGQSTIGFQGVEELREIFELLVAQGYGADRIRLDPSVVRGLGYYTGPVFEAELTFEIPDEKGRKRQFGSVAGGGRYDDLVKRFTGQEVPATGVSIGVDRLLAALREKDSVAAAEPGPVVVTVMDRDRMADYQAIVGDLRRAGIRAEVYLGNPKNFGNQMKYADKRGAPFAIIQGSDEAARGVVQVKDLVLGAQIAANATLEEWKDRPAQFEVPLADLVARLRALLADQG